MPHRAKRAVLLVGVAITAALASLPAAALETRSYAMSMFWHAMDSKDGDCPEGLNPKLKEQYELNLAALGYSRAEISTLMERYVEGGQGGWDQDKVRNLMNMRGRLDGKPVNAFAFPMAVADPKLKTPETKFAYGFNLDGHGPAEGSFEDPETHEAGVDHQLARVLGCISPMRGRLREGSAFWLFMWMAMKDVAPAWTFTITGDDLSKDGPVTLSVGRGMEPMKFNGNGTPRSGMTFRADPDPRMKGNVYHGQLKNGVVSITEPGSFYMLQDPLLFPAFTMQNFHARLTLKPDGTMEGIIGGYEPIEEVYFALGSGNLTFEENFSPELPGMYHLLRRYADANPDPKTGQNWSISAAYYLQGTTAHVVQRDAGQNQKPLKH